MADYEVTFARAARKELEALPNFLIQRIFLKIESLRETHRPPGCRKLQGADNLWRIRIGDYRVIYAIYDSKK
jgi:mRNA interferase RelE/StbE